MQFSFIAIIAAISTVAVAQSPRPWCNRGWTGNGGCEKTSGVYTFYCAASKGGVFTNHKEDAQDAGLGACEGGLGTIMCAR